MKGDCISSLTLVIQILFVFHLFMNTITILYRYFNVVINFDIMLREERKLDKPVLQSFFLAKKNKLVFHVTPVCKIGEFIVFIKLM